MNNSCCEYAVQNLIGNLFFVFKTDYTDSYEY